MSTYPLVTGESATIGFPVNDVTGNPMDLTGLQLRLFVPLDTASLILPAYAGSGEIIPPGGTDFVLHPSIIWVDLKPDNFPLIPRLYRCTPQVNDGSGWIGLRGHDHFINVRRS